MMQGQRRQWLALRGWRTVQMVAVAVAVGSVAGLAGCASRMEPRTASLEHTVPATVEAASGTPWLALPPSALGCSTSVQQRLQVQPPGQEAQVLDALLEVDAQALRLAVLRLGQMVGQLQWDGEQIQQQRSRWWPAILQPSQVLADVQLAFWPLDRLQRALPAAWSLEATLNGRVLRYAGMERVRMQFVNPQTLDIHHFPGPWSLRIETPKGTDLCQNGVDSP